MEPTIGRVKTKQFIFDVSRDGFLKVKFANGKSERSDYNVGTWTRLTCIGVMYVLVFAIWTTKAFDISFAGPYAQPHFQPVKQNVLPAEPMVIVLSYMFGNDAEIKIECFF